MSDVQDIIDAWQPHIAGIADWESLVAGIEVKPSGCGDIYEVPNPIPNRSGEDFCIADMRELVISEPHYHPTGHYELYFLMRGSGHFVVGTEEFDANAGEVVVNPPDTAHFVIPDKELVLAAVSAPPFQPETYIVVNDSDPTKQFDKAQFDRLNPEKS